jgi:hypothetical protein
MLFGYQESVAGMPSTVRQLRVVAARTNLVRLFDSVVVPRSTAWVAARSLTDRWQVLTAEVGGPWNINSSLLRTDGTFDGATTTLVATASAEPGGIALTPEPEFGHLLSYTLTRRDWDGHNIGSGIPTAVFGGVVSSTRLGAEAVAYASDRYWTAWQDGHEPPNTNVYVNTVRCAY